jgi:hypothetical protein
MRDIMNTSLNHALEKEVKHSREFKLAELRGISENLAEAEEKVSILRDRKWILVEELKELGHDFTATCEGMDVVLSAPPSMRF